MLITGEAAFRRIMRLPIPDVGMLQQKPEGLPLEPSRAYWSYGFLMVEGTDLEAFNAFIPCQLPKVVIGPELEELRQNGVSFFHGSVSGLSFLVLLLVFRFRLTRQGEKLAVMDEAKALLAATIENYFFAAFFVYLLHLGFSGNRTAA